MPNVPMPQYPSAQSRPIGTPYQRTDASTGGHELSQGLNQLGQGIADVGQAYNVHRARALQIRKQEELTKFNHGITSELYGAPEAMKTGETVSGAWGLDLSAEGGSGETVAIPNGYMNLQGKSAPAATKQVLDALKKRQDDIANGIDDEQLRAEFLADSNVLYEDTRRRMEVHASQQITVAEQASQKAMVEQGLTAISAAYDDEDAVQTQFGIMADGLRKSALSKEDGDGKVAALQATIAKTRVERFLAAQDYAGASRVLDASNRVLSPDDSVRLGKAITDVKLDVESEKTARNIIGLARPEGGGPVDVNQALAAVEAIPPGPEHDKVLGLVQHYTALADKEWDNTVAKQYSSAFSTYLKASAVAPADPRAVIPQRQQEWLIENAPEKWDALLNKYEQDKASARRDRLHGGGGKAGASRARALIEFKADVAANPEKYADPTYSTNNFMTEWGPRLDPKDLDVAGNLVAATKKDKKESMAEFSRYVGDRVREAPMFQRQTSKAAQVEATNAANQYRAFMGDARRDFIEKNKREPSREEMDAMDAAAWTHVVTKKSLFGIDALWPDSETEAFKTPRSKESDDAEAEAVASAPAAQNTQKTIVRYKRSPDGKRRVAVYSDGTYGPEETVSP